MLYRFAFQYSHQCGHISMAFDFTLTGKIELFKIVNHGLNGGSCFADLVIGLQLIIKLSFIAYGFIAGSQFKGSLLYLLIHFSLSFTFLLFLRISALVCTTSRQYSSNPGNVHPRYDIVLTLYRLLIKLMFSIAIKVLLAFLGKHIFGTHNRFASLNDNK